MEWTRGESIVDGSQYDNQMRVFLEHNHDACTQAFVAYECYVMLRFLSQTALALMGSVLKHVVKNSYMFVTITITKTS